MNRRLLLVFIVVSFFMCNEVGAVTLNDLYNDVSVLKKNYNAAQKKANMTKQELNNVKASIINTENEIKTAQNEIIKAEEEIQVSEENIAEKKEETNQMLLYLQLMNSNGDSMLEYVMDADSYTELIYRYSVVTQMSDYNQEIITELNSLVEALNNKKKELNKKQEALAIKKQELQAKQMIVQTQYKDQYDDSLDIASQIKEKEKMIKKYKSMGCSMNQNVETCNGVPAVDGWTYPLRSFYQSSNYGWDENRYHYAVDLAVVEGSNVYAIANGEVISSRVYWSLNNPGTSCGGYVIQIRHNYRGSYYVSLYMHLLTPYVSVGDKVSGGQLIATSGGGSSANAKYNDTCSGGAHLHFAMSTGRDHIQSSSSVGSTFNPARFFPAMGGIGSRM